MFCKYCHRNIYPYNAFDRDLNDNKFYHYTIDCDSIPTNDLHKEIQLYNILIAQQIYTKLKCINAILYDMSNSYKESIKKDL